MVPELITLGMLSAAFLPSEHSQQIVHRDRAHFGRELGHGADDRALLHQVHRLLGAVHRQDLDAGAVGVSDGLKDASSITSEALKIPPTVLLA